MTIWAKEPYQTDMVSRFDFEHVKENNGQIINKIR